jgi:hypothetical protein
MLHVNINVMVLELKPFEAEDLQRELFCCSNVEFLQIAAAESVFSC